MLALCSHILPRMLRWSLTGSRERLAGQGVNGPSTWCEVCRLWVACTITEFGSQESKLACTGCNALRSCFGGDACKLAECGVAYVL